jgi:membrane protease YdiL (CAAX protease family)
MLKTIAQQVLFFLQIGADPSLTPEMLEGRKLAVIGIIYLVLLLLGAAINLALLLRVLVHPLCWRERVERVLARVWPGHDILRLLGWLLVLHVLGSVIYSATASPAPEAMRKTALPLIMQSIVFHWAGLALILIYMRRHQQQRIRAFFPSRTGYLVIIPYLFVGALFWQMLLRWHGVDITMQDVAWMVTGDYTWPVRLYILLMAVLLAPLAEELLFRGIALPFLSVRVGSIPAILLVSALFAAIHFHLPSAFPLFVIGIGLSVTYFYSGSIVAPIMMHAAFNGVNLCMLLAVRHLN